MADLKAVTRALLASGAPIQDMNVVRKHLSTYPGRAPGAGDARAGARAGDLGRRWRRSVGDRRGPAPRIRAPMPTRWRSSRAGASRRRERAEHLQRGARGEVDETPKPGDPLFARVEDTHGRDRAPQSRGRAAVFAQAGVRPVLLGDTITGEARDVAQVMAAIAREIVALRPAVRAPGGADLGRRMHGHDARSWPRRALLRSSFWRWRRELDGAPGVWAIAADTDGIDGSERQCRRHSVPRHPGARRGRRARRACAARRQRRLRRFFGALGDLVVTGPTRTNVNDYPRAGAVADHAADPAP